MIEDTFLILFIAVLTAFFSEGLTYLLIYRTEKYKKLTAEVEKHSKKLEKKKEIVTDISKQGGQKKKIERVEEKLKSHNRDLSMVKMKSMFAIGFTFTALMGMFNSIFVFAICAGKGYSAFFRFDGRIVAKLPFVPISFLQGLSHRNIRGEDYTDCSFIFFYILCTMSIRQNIQKMLGFAPSRAVSKVGGGLFNPPQGSK